MEVLNVCSRCGERKVKDVKEELELLMQSKVNAAPGQCGICLKVLLPEMLSTDGGIQPESADHDHIQCKDKTTSTGSNIKPESADHNQSEDNLTASTENNIQLESVDHDQSEDKTTSTYSNIKPESADHNQSEDNLSASTENNIQLESLDHKQREDKATNTCRPTSTSVSTNTDSDKENSTEQQIQKSTRKTVKKEPVDVVVSFDSLKAKKNGETTNLTSKNKRKRARPLKMKTVKYDDYDYGDVGDDDDSFDVFFKPESDSGSSDDMTLTVSKKRKVKKKRKQNANKGKSTPKASAKKSTGKKPTPKKKTQQKINKKTDFSKLPEVTGTELKIRRAVDPTILAMLDTESRPTRAFICKECKEGFFFVQSFISHMTVHTGEKLMIPKPYVCPYCSIHLLNFTTMERHFAVHADKKEHVCDRVGCNSSFVCKRYLKKHIRQKHDGVRYKQNKVNKVKEGKSEFKERIFACTRCDFKTKEKKCLTQHLNGPHGEHEMLFQCRICHKRYNDKNSLNKHERCVHQGEKKHTCEHCGYATFYKGDLVKHQRIHSGEKPFTCDRCGYRCNRVSNLNIHMKIHTGEKTYKCYACDMMFKSIKTCKTHEKSHHPEAKPIADLAESRHISEEAVDRTVSQGGLEKLLHVHPSHAQPIQGYPVSITIPPVVVNPIQASGSTHHTHHASRTSSEEWARAVELLHNFHPV